MGKISIAGCALIALAAVIANGFGGETSKPAAATELLTPDEAREVNGVISAAIAAGFPDAAKASAHMGKLNVSANFDPAKDPPPLPSSASGMQMTNNTGMTYSYTFNGLHFKLADGSWIISLQYHFKPKPGDSVNDAEAPEVKLADLTASADAAHPFDAEKTAASWLTAVPAANKARSVALMNKLVPVLNHLKLRLDDLAPAIVLLNRAGWPDAAATSLSVADQRARLYWQLKPWTTPDAPFDPSSMYPGASGEEDAWKKAHPQFTPEPPHVALRRALFRWCQRQIPFEYPEDAMLTPDVAAAVTKAMLDPKDPQGYGARVDALLAGARLPATPSKDADLLGKLQSWESHPRKARMTVSGQGGKPKNGSISMSTSFDALPPAYEPKKADLDGLIALLADTRPSRFWDFSGARTVGDNAWRAATKLLGADPRKMANYPIERPWTAAERTAAAAAIQLWWKDHRKEYVDK